MKMTTIKYPLAKETINEADIDALCQWLKSYPRLTKGELTWEVEEKWAEFIGTKHAVFNNSGSSANLLMIYAAITAGRIKNKKIAVPAVGWVTTIAPAMQFGLKPIMVGTDPKTYGMDLDELEKICETEKPDAVIFVQVLGVPHYKERLLQLKEKYGFCLLEDACAALGAAYADGSKVGTIGDMSSFSFYFGHQLSTIEGGMVNTNDKELYELLLMLRSHGWGKDLDKESYNQLMNDNEVDDFHQPFTFFICELLTYRLSLGCGKLKKLIGSPREETKTIYIMQKILRDMLNFKIGGKISPYLFHLERWQIPQPTARKLLLAL